MKDKPPITTSAPENMDKPKTATKIENVDPKLAAQVWHSFRNAEYRNWKDYKEAQLRDNILQQFQVDNNTLMQDVRDMQCLVDKGVVNLPKPPDPCSTLAPGMKVSDANVVSPVPGSSCDMQVDGCMPTMQ